MLDRPRGGAPTVVVQARLKLVLNADQALAGQGLGGLNPGDWIRFATEPLLHGFVLTPPAR